MYCGALRHIPTKTLDQFFIVQSSRLVFGKEKSVLWHGGGALGTLLGIFVYILRFYGACLRSSVCGISRHRGGISCRRYIALDSVYQRFREGSISRARISRDHSSTPSASRADFAASLSASFTLRARPTPISLPLITQTQVYVLL